MDEEIKKIYAAFGYDVSKGLRKLNQITDKEALTIAKIFNNKLDWEVYLRKKGKDGQIGLKSSSTITITHHKSFGRGTYESMTNDTMYIRKDSIAGPTFSNGGMNLVNQYLISIGIERDILTPSKLEEIISEKLDTQKLHKF